MRWIGTLAGMLIGTAVVVVAAHLLGLQDLLRDAITHGKMLDWLMGAFSVVWLLVLVKAPWDLYFEAHRVAFEQQRARERGIAIAKGREGYVLAVRRRLALFAVGLHIVSAAVAAAVAYGTHGNTGYYFAGFYVLSTFFRPVIAGYFYLRGRLQAVAQEAHFPREDVKTFEQRLARSEEILRSAQAIWDARERAQAETAAHIEDDLRDLRQRQAAISREFETTISRLTDNQEVIQGIQAFVRLIATSAQGPA